MASQWYIRVAEGAAILAGAFAIYELGKYVASRAVKGAPVVLKAATDAAGEVMPVESWRPSIAGHSTDHTRQATEPLVFAAVRDVHYDPQENAR